MIEDLLELSLGLRRLARFEVGLSTNVGGVKRPKLKRSWGSEFVGRGRLEKLESLAGIAIVQCNLGTDGRQPVRLDHGIERRFFGDLIGHLLRLSIISGAGQG